MQGERPFKARVVLIDRESVLTEQGPSAFAEQHGFRMLADDGVGTSPILRFGVETFEPAEGFKPTKPYRTRLVWRDLEGNSQSKLLLSPPKTVLAIAVRGEREAASVTEGAEARPISRRKRVRTKSTASTVPEPV
jgi:hypothetical protein